MHKEPAKNGFMMDSISFNNVKYLKYWDQDYPYLNGSNDTANYLPVPVKSQSQKHLINTNIMRKII